MKSKMLVAVLIAGIFGCVASSATAQVNYPVISGQLSRSIYRYSTMGDIVGEYQWVVDGDYVAITTTNKHGGDIISVFHEDSGIPGALSPVFTSVFYGSPAQIRPTNLTYYFDPADGHTEVYGSFILEGKTLYTVTWTDPDWSVWTYLTWGSGASVGDFGSEIDRTHLGTLPGYPREWGFYAPSMMMVSNQPNVIVVYDKEALVKLQASTNLSSWYDIDANYQYVTNYFVAGVEFVAGALKPIAPTTNGFGPKHFFRLKQM